VLTLTLVSAEHRASSTALRRVAGNFGLGSGATVAGFIVAAADDLRAFQALYLFDGVTFAVFALVVLVAIPNPRLAKTAPASGGGTGFRAVARDRLFLILTAANTVLVMTGGALFSNIRALEAAALAQPRQTLTPAQIRALAAEAMAHLHEVAAKLTELSALAGDDEPGEGKP
jgi:hypothetical protein